MVPVTQNSVGASARHISFSKW